MTYISQRTVPVDFFIPLSGVVDDDFPAVGDLTDIATGLTADFSTDTSLSNQHVGLIVNSIVGTYTCTVNGTSISEVNAVPTASDTEVFTIDATGRYQTLKKWYLITSVAFTGGTSIDYDLQKLGYWDWSNANFQLIGFRADLRIAGTNPDIRITIYHVKNTGDNKYELLALEDFGIDSTGVNGEWVDHIRTSSEDRSYTMPVELADNNSMNVIKCTDYSSYWGRDSIVQGASSEGIIITFTGEPAGGLTAIDSATIVMTIKSE